VRIPQTEHLRFEPMNLSYRKSFADAPPVGPDQAASSYMGIKIAAQRRAIPSPQGRGLGEGKETVDQSRGSARTSTPKRFLQEPRFHKSLLINAAISRFMGRGKRPLINSQVLARTIGFPPDC
jgi:hypothetical protein